MAERVIVLTTPIAIAEGGLTGSYAHVKIDDTRSSDEHQFYRANIVYGNVVGGVFIKGPLPPPYPQYPRQLRVKKRTHPAAFAAITNKAAQQAGDKWRRTEHEAAYEHLLNDPEYNIEGTIETVS
jgi:hypothetical protein